MKRCTPAIRNVGADIAALALHALAEVMEKARVARLTRYQHILLRLGELIAYAECAGSLSRRAALMAEGKLNEKANQRFDATALAAISRVFAREAALKVAEEGLRWVIGAGGVSDAEMAAFEASFGAARHSPRAGGPDFGHGLHSRRTVRPRGASAAGSGCVSV